MSHNNILLETYTRVHKKISIVAFVMSSLSLFIVWGLLWNIYRAQKQEDLRHLSYVAVTISNLIEILAKDEAAGNRKLDYASLINRVKTNLTSAGKSFPGMGESGEIIIGKKTEGNVDFLMVLRNQKKIESDIHYSRVSHLPMHAALSGKNGVMVTRDYRGKNVMVAYQSIPSLQMGVAVKTDLFELQFHYLKTAGYALALSIILYFIGTRIFSRAVEEMLNMFEIREQKYHAYISYAPIGMAVFDEKGKFLEVNDKASELMGMERSELLQTSLGQIRPDILLTPAQDTLSNKLLKIFNPDTRYVNLKNEYYYLMTNIVRFSSNRYLCFFTDLTARREVEIKLQESEEKFRGLYNSTKDAIIMADESGKIVLWNKGAESTFGYTFPEVWQKTISDLIIPEEFREAHDEGFRRYAATGQGKLVGTTFEFMALTKTGKKIPVEITLGSLLLGEKWHAIAIVRDVSIRKQMEAQLRQSSKLATLGEMATGIAHELNQPLTVIRMGSQMIDRDLKKKKPLDMDFLNDQISKFLRNVERATKIIDHLRLFGRKATGEGSLFNVNSPIQSAVDLLKTQLVHNSINLVLNLAPSLPEIKGDENSLEQVFINLMMNTIDVFGDEPWLENPEITISTELDKTEHVVEVRYKNNGPRIPEEILDKIFEPFFTTKPPGKGTGLGLSISYGIVQSHNGTMIVENRDEGPLFTINLPVSLAV